MMSSSQVCEYHMLGKCRFGNRCWKSHDLGTSRNRELFDTEPYLSEPPSTHTDFRIFQNGVNISELTAQFDEYERKYQLERAMNVRPILRQPDNAKVTIEKMVKELSVAKKTESGINVEENANNLHILDQKNTKESTENNGADWNNIILSAVDSDLLCNICFEIFIKPTVVNCSHTFCASCIHVWTLRVKNCPICRVEVKSKSYCLTLESFIEKIVEHLPAEIKNKRDAAIKERIKKRNKRPKRVKPTSTSSDFSGFMFMDRQAEAITQPPQFLVERNVDINGDILFSESEMSEMFGMNLHDPVVSTSRVNTLMPDFLPENYYRDIMHDSSARH